MSRASSPGAPAWESQSAIEAQLRADPEASQERIAELEAAPKRVAGEWKLPNGYTAEHGDVVQERICPHCFQSVANVTRVDCETPDAHEWFWDVLSGTETGWASSMSEAQSAADAALVAEGWQLR